MDFGNDDNDERNPFDSQDFNMKRIEDELQQQQQQQEEEENQNEQPQPQSQSSQPFGFIGDVDHAMLNMMDKVDEYLTNENVNALMGSQSQSTPPRSQFQQSSSTPPQAPQAPQAPPPPPPKSIQQEKTRKNTEILWSNPAYLVTNVPVWTDADNDNVVYSDFEDAEAAVAQTLNATDAQLVALGQSAAAAAAAATTTTTTATAAAAPITTATSKSTKLTKTSVKKILPLPEYIVSRRHFDEHTSIDIPDVFKLPAYLGARLTSVSRLQFRQFYHHVGEYWIEFTDMPRFKTVLKSMRISLRKTELGEKERAKKIYEDKHLLMLSGTTREREIRQGLRINLPPITSAFITEQTSSTFLTLVVLLVFDEWRTDSVSDSITEVTPQAPVSYYTILQSEVIGAINKPRSSPQARAQSKSKQRAVVDPESDA